MPTRPAMSGMTARATRIAFYCRVSTEDQAERATVQNQIDYLHRKYEVDLQPDSPTPMHLVDEFVDDGHSGALPLASRPEGARLLDEARQGQLDAIVIYKLDRLGRTAKVLLDAHEQLEQHGVAIISATEPFDTRTSIGRFVFQLLGSIAELERATIRDRTNLGRDRKARAGKFVNGPIPFGYDVDHGGFLVPSNRRIEELDCTEAELAQQIFDRFGAGVSGRQIAKWLNRYGIPSPRRYKIRNGAERAVVTAYWTPDRLWDMVRNSLYRGVRVLHHASGDIAQSVPPLVDDIRWHRANAGLARNRQHRMAESKYVYLLRGHLYCSGCGSMMLGNYQVRDRTLYYRCPKAIEKPKGERGACGDGYVRGEPVEDLVLREIDTFVTNPAASVDEVRAHIRGQQSDVERTRAAAARIKERLRETEDSKRDVLALVRRRRITIDEADRQLEQIDIEASELRRDLDELARQGAFAEAMEQQLLDTARLLEEIRDDWQTYRAQNDRAAMQPIVHQLLVKISVRPDGSGIARTYTFDLSTTAAGSPKYAAPLGELGRLLQLARGVGLAAD